MAHAAAPHHSSAQAELMKFVLDANEPQQTPCPLHHDKNCAAMCCCLTALPVLSGASIQSLFSTKLIQHRFARSERAEDHLIGPMRKPPRAA
jgi:hypothetical protein